MMKYLIIENKEQEVDEYLYDIADSSGIMGTKYISATIIIISLIIKIL